MIRPDKSSSINYPTVRRLGLEGACSARPRTRVIMTANQISRQRLQSIVMTVRPTVFDRHVPALYEATFGAEYSSNGGSLVRPPKGKIPNHGRRRLLRVGRERPRRRRPAETHDELPSSHQSTLSSLSHAQPIVVEQRIGVRAIAFQASVARRGRLHPSGGGHSTTTGVAPEPEATLAAGGVRCLGSTCRRRVGPNPPLVTHLDLRNDASHARRSPTPT